MKAKLITISLASFMALLAVWGVFLAFDWGEEYFTTKQSPQYESLPFEFKLKTDPKDVIFSEAYTTGDGTDVVKYAYLTDEAGPQPNEDVTRRTPDSYTEVVEKFEDSEGEPMEKLKTTFLSKPQFYEDNGQWRQIEYATTTPEIFSMSGAVPYVKQRELVELLLPGEPVFAASATYYPDPNTELVSVDGQIDAYYPNDVSSVGNACDGAKSIGSKSASDSGTIIQAFGYYSAIDNSPMLENFGEDFFNCTLTRGFILFDTSSLPNDSNISASTINLYVTQAYDEFSDVIAINTATPASSIALANSDFGSVGSSDMATRVNISSITTSAYNTFTLNSSGRAQISLTGISKFSVRLGQDVDDVYSFISFGTLSVGIVFSSAEVSGTSQDPKLEVTYTAPSSFSFGMWFPF